MEAEALYKKRLAKGKLRQRKEEKTDLEIVASSLANSSCRMYARVRMNQPDKWPEADPQFPEVAFVGRSNVGKSSLLNTISVFGTIARVSPMPGKTTEAAWFRNRKVKLDVVYMPGYGFNDRAKLFGPEAIEFVRKRTSLKCIYVLIDARHGFKRADHEWLEELGNVGPTKQVILTKCDLLTPKDLVKMASLVRSDLEVHRRVEQKLLLSSTTTYSGIHEIRLDLCRRCGCDTRLKRMRYTDEFPFDVPDSNRNAPRGTRRFPASPPTDDQLISAAHVQRNPPEDEEMAREVLGGPGGRAFQDLQGRRMRTPAERPRRRWAEG